MARAFISIVVALFCLIFVASATPVNLVAKAAQDVYVPRIIKPDASSVWVTQHSATVVWDASNAPASISNKASVLLHGYGTVAEGFDLRVGNVTFTVPLVAPGSYIITLFGDSGNFSPNFTITN